MFVKLITTSLCIAYCFTFRITLSGILILPSAKKKTLKKLKFDSYESNITFPLRLIFIKSSTIEKGKRSKSFDSFRYFFSSSSYLSLSLSRHYILLCLPCTTTTTTRWWWWEVLLLFNFCMYKETFVKRSFTLVI